MPATFSDRIAAVTQVKQSCLCVGLDPDPVKLPDHLRALGSDVEAISQFTRHIMHATSAYTTAFKFNIAFFEALGSKGLDILADALASVPEHALTIADAKRGDIGNSARFYAKTFFQDLPFDAVTVSPYMGRDSVQPFLEYDGKGVFVLVHTSNPGAKDFQTLQIEDRTLYEIVAEQAVTWSDDLPGTVGFVVGATDPAAIELLRREHESVPFLIPGVGTQGGVAGHVMKASGSGPVLINSSRQIIYASSGEDFAESAASASKWLRDELNAARVVGQP